MTTIPTRAAQYLSVAVFMFGVLVALPQAARAAAPVLSNIASTTTATSATVSWTATYDTPSGPFATTHSASLFDLLPSTTYHYRIASGDGAGAAASSTLVTFTTQASTTPPDTTPPTISAVASSTTATTATVSWTTDEPATSAVNYGLTAAYGAASSSPALATSHALQLAGLVPNTAYHFSVVSADASGNTASTSDFTFMTLPPAASTTDGAILGASIEANGDIADITIQGMAPGGTYALTPDTAPKLFFTVTSAGYTSTGAPTTVTRTVLGTISNRQPYPNGASTTEAVVGGNLVAQVWLSDDIFAGDTVTLNGLSGWYTQGTTTQPVNNLAVTNSSNASSARPIGAWVTPTNLRRAPGAGYTAEFFVTSRYPRNNGQVAAVSFIASDGTNSVTHTASSMTQSAYLGSYACTATAGSATLTNCSSTTGAIAGQYVTVSTGSASAVNVGEPQIASVGTTTITLTTNATANGAVKVTLGNPVYVYSATFSDAELSALAQGVATMRAIAYPNVGTTTLDTAQGADGTPIASGTVTPNLKNLQFLNDKTNAYQPVYAWVSPAGAGASPVATTSAADPGTSGYFGTIGAAAAAIKDYYAANGGHANACGGVIYLKAGTTVGFGSGLSSLVPTNCATYLTVSAEPGHSAADTGITASPNFTDPGYTTLFQNLKFTDNAGAKIVFYGPDDANANPRKAHLVFQNSWLVETQTSPVAFMYLIGLREFYNSIVDQTLGNGSILRPYSVTGVANTQFGSSILNSSVTAYTSLGNVYKNSPLGGVPAAATYPYYIQPTSVTTAFDKLMAGQDPNLSSATHGQNSNWGIAQDVMEAQGTAVIQPALTFAADSDTDPLQNFLRQYTTVVGARTNQLYESKGTSPIVKTSTNLFNVDYQINRKGDYFPSDGGPSGNRTGSWRSRFGVTNVGNVAGGATDGTTAPSFSSWIGDFFGLSGSGTQGYDQKSYTWKAANQNSATGGNNTGMGWYKPQVTTGLTNRVPGGMAGFPGDIEGSPRKNDGTGCAGAYECSSGLVGRGIL